LAPPSRLCGTQPRLFRYSNVARASRQDTYVPSAARPRVARRVDRRGACLAPQVHALLAELTYQPCHRALTHPADNRPSTTIEQSAYKRHHQLVRLGLGEQDLRDTLARLAPEVEPRIQEAGMHSPLLHSPGCATHSPA